MKRRPKTILRHGHIIGYAILLALVQLGQHMISLKKEPPIKPGTVDPYEPPKRMQLH